MGSELPAVHPPSSGQKGRLPSLSSTRCRRHRQQTSLWETPARFWRLQPGFKFPDSGAFLPSGVLRVTAIHFPNRLQSNTSPRERPVRWWHKGERGGMNPVCRLGTYVLCRAVTEPQTIFQAPRQAPGQECHRGRNSLQKLPFLLSQTPLHARASGLVSVPVLVSSSAPLISRSPSHRCLLLPCKATACAVVTAGWKAQANHSRVHR